MHSNDLYCPKANLAISLLVSMLILACILGTGRSASAHGGYHYAGVTQTSLSSLAQATIRQNSIPRGKWVHAFGWVVLWDLDHSGQYAEAGVGWSSWWQIPRGQVALWYATREKNTGVVVGSVPTGTPVEVTVIKTTTAEVAEITWVWNDPTTGERDTIRAYPSVPGWTDLDGIHPIKVEVYSYTGKHPRVNFSFSRTNVDPAVDIKAYLKADKPYDFTPESTIENFRVSGP